MVLVGVKENQIPQLKPFLQVTINPQKIFPPSAVEVLPNVKVIISNNTVLNIVNEFKVAPTGNLTFEETAQLVQES